MSLLNTGRSELEQANYASKTSTDMANKRQAQKSSLEYQNDVANNNRNGALAGSAVNLGIAYAGYKHDQQVSEAKGLASREALGNSGGMNNSATGNSLANNDAFRSGTGDQAIQGAGGNGGVVGSDAGGKSFNDAGTQITAPAQGLARSNATGSVEGSNAGGNAYDNATGGGYNTADPVGASTGSAATPETTQSLNTDVTNSSSAGSSSGENSGGSSGGAGGAAGAAFLVGGLYQLFSSF